MLAIIEDAYEAKTEWRVIVWTDETDWSIPEEDDEVSRWEDDSGC